MGLNRSKLSKALDLEFPDISAEDLDKLADFIEGFSPFFPELESNYSWALQEMDNLNMEREDYPLHMVDRRENIREINKIKRALLLFCKLDARYLEPLLLEYSSDKYEKSLNEDPYFESEPEEGLNNLIDKEEVLRFILQITSVAQDDEAGGENQRPIEDVIDELTQDMELVARSTPSRGNTNWEAVNAVNGLRIMWNQNSIKRAPYSLNPASPFAKFLDAGFKFLKIKSKPKQAFARWEKVGKAQAKIEEKAIAERLKLVPVKQPQKRQTNGD